MLFIREEGLLLLRRLWEIKVVQNNYRAKMWNIFNVFSFFKKIWKSITFMAVTKSPHLSMLSIDEYNKKNGKLIALRLILFPTCKKVL